uniref:Uncharacterized protein n=1 Tax=Chenopodium quinoa TaxID=63459 RepID=A0A803KTL4_CHEQI
MMNIRNNRFVLFTLVVLLAFSSLGSSAHAIRLLSEDSGAAGEYHSQIYVRARSTMSYWLERLSSGPSPGGGGGH